MSEEQDNLDLEEALVCTVIACSSIVHASSLENSTRNRKVWCKDYFRERDDFGAYRLTLEELWFNDPFSFRRYLRMSAKNFEVMNFEKF